MSRAGRTLRFEDCGAQNLSCPQLCKNVVGLGKRECRRLGPDFSLRGNLKKIQPVLAREVGNRDQLSFFPEKIIREARNIAHVDSSAYHLAALSYRAQRR